MTRTKCEVFSRAMGYYRPVSNFNIGKYQEFTERASFKEDYALDTGNKHIQLLKGAVCM